MKGMKTTVFLLLAAMAVFVNAFPRERDVESIEDDAEDIPLPEVPAVSVPAGGPAFGFVPSFYTFFPDFDLISRIRGLVTRLRTQVGDSFGEIDWSKGNTTSTTKVIDGHVVTVNETSYKDDDSDLVLHVKVIDVKPTEGADDVSAEGADSSSPKEDLAPPAPSSEDAEGNEIPKQPEEGVAESLDFVMHPEETREHLVETRENLSPDYLDDVDTPVEEVDNDIDGSFGRKPISLDNDILVNKIYEANHMVMIPDDVELFVPDKNVYTVNENNEYVYNPNKKDSYESIPDSRDMYEIYPLSRFQKRPQSESLVRYYR